MKKAFLAAGVLALFGLSLFAQPQRTTKLPEYP